MPKLTPPSRRQALVKEYRLLIGYDPFEDDPTRSEADVEQTLTEWRDEHGRNGGPSYGGALDVDGEEVPAYGYTRKGTFICNARVSECGRFDEKPSYYGLTEAQADELERLNKGRNLLAYA